MKAIAGLLTVLFLCGCSTPYILEHHHPEDQSASLARGPIPDALMLKKGETITWVFAGESVTQPIGGCLDYDQKRLVSPASSYRMSRPGAALYEKTVDALRRRGVATERCYLPPSRAADRKRLALFVEEMELYRIHRKTGDRIVSKAIVLLRLEGHKDECRLQASADVPPERDVFEALAEALLGQIIQ